MSEPLRLLFVLLGLRRLRPAGAACAECTPWRMAGNRTAVLWVNIPVSRAQALPIGPRYLQMEPAPFWDWDSSEAGSRASSS